MRQVVTRLLAVRVMQAIGVKVVDVLVERATKRDVQDLHPATDSQRGDVLLQGPVCQPQFDVIKLFIGQVAEWVWCLTIKSGVHINTAGKQETIQAGKQRIKHAKIVQEWNKDRNAAGMFYGMNIGPVVAINGAFRPICIICVAGDADKWTHSRFSFYKMISRDVIVCGRLNRALLK